MKKLLIFVLSIFFSVQAFCQIRVGLLNGPSCVPMVYMMETVFALDGNELEYQQYPDAMSVVPKLLKNEIDITFLPPNVAAKLFKSSNKAIVCAGVTGEGNLSIITKDTSVYKLSDLKGKTLHVAGQGATPEYLVKYLLEKNNLSEENVKLDFSIPTSQLAAMLISGKIKYAVVPEPFATIAAMKDKAVIKAVDLQKEYEAVTENGKNYPMTVMVIRSSFAEENRELVNLFLETYKESLNWVLENPKLAGNYCEKFNLGLAKNVVAAAVPQANYVFSDVFECKDSVEELLGLFLNYDSESIGGNLPESDFYLK